MLISLISCICALFGFVVMIRILQHNYDRKLKHTKGFQIGFMALYLVAAANRVDFMLISATSAGYNFSDQALKAGLGTILFSLLCIPYYYHCIWKRAHRRLS